MREGKRLLPSLLVIALTFISLWFATICTLTENVLGNATLVYAQESGKGGVM